MPKYFETQSFSTDYGNMQVIAMKRGNLVNTVHYVSRRPKVVREIKARIALRTWFLSRGFVRPSLRKIMRYSK